MNCASEPVVCNDPCMTENEPSPWEARLIWPGSLVGIQTAADRHGVDRSTIVRWIKDGKIVPLAKLDDRGAYVFDEADLPKVKLSL